MSCMSLCDTVLPLLCINLLSLLSDGELFDTLCLLCCSSCFSLLSKDFLWVLLVVALCVCDVTWLLLCIPPFCMFVSMELLLPSKNTSRNIKMRLIAAITATLYSLGIIVDNKYKLPLLFSGLGLYCGLNLCAWVLTCCSNDAVTCCVCGCTCGWICCIDIACCSKGSACCSNCR